jgi:hypothetical protein
MPEFTIVPEWRDDQQATGWPFSLDVKPSNQAGYFIPDSTFLDAAFYPVGGTVGLYISSIAVASGLVTITVSDSGINGLATGSFSLLNPPSLIDFFDSFGRPAGVIVSDPTRLAVFQAWATGTQTFTADQTEFVATVYQPSPEIGFRGFVLADGSLVTGDIWLVGDDGVVVRNDPGNPEPVIRVDAVGDPLFARRLCQPDNLFVTPRYVQQIKVISGNGTFTVTPDQTGNFEISVGSNLATDVALRVRTTNSGLVFEVMGSSSAV